MKTAKVKAQELYPDESGFDGFTFDSRNEKSHFSERQAYIKGYDTAMQDFLEKAEYAISMISRHYVGEDYSFDQIWEQFKSYIENESEN